MSDIYDLAILGGGPAGITAAIYASRARLNTIWIDKNFAPGGQVTATYAVDNYPGMPGISGMDLGEAFGAHARKLGLEPQREKILSLENISGEIKTIRTKKHEYQAKALILAFGAEHRKLDIPGEDDLSGLGVSYGVSAPGAVTTEMVKTMNKDAIIFACANPTPEIFPDDAKAGGAKVISTGRSDFPNQINNVLAFPGIFRGAFDVRASDINDEMKIAASKALADLITDEELSPEYIIPKAFDKRVGPAVAKAVAEAAKATGVARI